MQTTIKATACSITRTNVGCIIPHLSLAELEDGQLMNGNTQPRHVCILCVLCVPNVRMNLLLASVNLYDYLCIFFLRKSFCIILVV